MQTCPICGAESKECFQCTIMRRHKVKYYQCIQCRFLQTEHPFWLEEAYANSMNKEDTGILERNILMSELSTIILYSSFDRNGLFLDYAGGYGIFTRLMRDVGFNYYWTDRYTKNIIAGGFEYESSQKSSIELITAFEVFEHFVNPIEELDALLKLSRNILFSTKLLPLPAPPISTWWYYGIEHGQHVSFYSIETCRAIAKRYGLNFYSFGPCHLLTEKVINERMVNILIKKKSWGILQYIRSRMISKTITDSDSVKESRQ
jgi:hypothetical protein